MPTALTPAPRFPTDACAGAAAATRIRPPIPKVWPAVLILATIENQAMHERYWKQHVVPQLKAHPRFLARLPLPDDAAPASVPVPARGTACSGLSSLFRDDTPSLPRIAADRCHDEDHWARSSSFRYVGHPAPAAPAPR